MFYPKIILETIILKDSAYLLCVTLHTRWCLCIYVIVGFRYFQI